MNPDFEHYLVFKRTPNDCGENFYGVAIVDGDFIGHDSALREAVDADPPKIHYPGIYLTVNTTSGTIREHKVSITIEGVA